MKTPTAKNYENFKSTFTRHFLFPTKLPEFVFRRRERYKVVIRESGELHKLETFAGLAREFGDQELNYLMLEPDAATIFKPSGRFAAYTLSCRSNFENEWINQLRGFGQNNDELRKTWPWMYASVQCYYGSSGLWCSYHDNHMFELDMFYVPESCDTVQLFGVESWSFEVMKSESISHRLNYADFELDSLKRNYFEE